MGKVLRNLSTLSIIMKIDVSYKEADKILSYLIKKAGCKTTCYVAGLLMIDHHVAYAYDIKKSRIMPIKVDERKRLYAKNKETVVKMFEHSSNGSSIIVNTSNKTFVLLKPFTQYEDIAIEADLNCII